MSDAFWNFDCAAATEFKFCKRQPNDFVWFVELEASSIGATFSECVKQDAGNQIAAVLLSGVDAFAREYFGTAETRTKKPRTMAAPAAASAVARTHAELPLDLFLECVLEQQGGSGSEGAGAARRLVHATAIGWFGTQLASGAPRAFLGGSNAGRAVAAYRLWVFGRHEPSMSASLATAMVAHLDAPADRHTWLAACQRYRGELPISVLSGTPLDSSASPASPQRVLDAAAQLGAAAAGRYCARDEWRFPQPTCVLRVPLEKLVGYGVRRSFLLLQPPLLQYAAGAAAGGQPLLVHKLYRIDVLPARLAQQSPAGAAVVQWLTSEPRRFSARFGSAARADAQLSAFASYVADRVSLFDSALGAFKCHSLLLTALLGSQTAHQPAQRGLRVHLLVCGPPDQSKSFVMEQVALMSVPGTVAKFERETLRSLEYEGAVRDTIKIIDELDERQVARTSTSDAKAIFKSVLTTGELHTQRCYGTTVKVRHDVKHFALIAGVNLPLADIDVPIATRCIVADTTATVDLQRDDQRTEAQQMARAADADAVAQRADLQNDAQCMHALVVLAEAAIANNALTDVSLSVLPHLYTAYADALRQHWNMVLRNRQYQQVCALTRVLVLQAAVHRLYTDAQWPCRGAALSAHHILLLQPLLVDSVQLGCIALDLVAVHLVPVAVHAELKQQALRQLAVRPGRLLCGFSATHGQPYTLATHALEAPRLAAEPLDDCAVRQRLAHVGMPATPHNVALFHNSLARP